MDIKEVLRTQSKVSAAAGYMAGLWLLLSICGTLAAQSQPARANATATLQVESRIVLLDVAVTDRQGKPVLDLRPDEFHIFERNVPQALKSFEPPSAHTMPQGSAGKVLVNSTADLAKIGQAPVTLILIDELNMNFPDRAYARTKLIEWLSRQPEVLSQPTALLAVTYKDFHVLRDYTQDRNALLDVMKKHTGDVVWRQDSTGRTGAKASENMFATLGALEQVAQATRGVFGRKNVVWVGNGFPSVTMGDVGRTSSDEIAAALRHLSTLMLHSRMTLSVVGGLNEVMPAITMETTADQDSAVVNQYTGLNMTNDNLMFSALAPPTGGHAYGGRNDPDAEIGQSVDEGASFYTLSYRPSDASNDPKKYRKIRVEVSRPGLHVQTRDGYFEEPKQPDTPAPIPTQQLAFDLYGAAMSTISYTDLHISAERAGSTDFTLHTAARDLAWRDLADGRRHADLVLLAACLSPQNKLLSKTFATLGSNTEASLTSIGGATTALHMHVVTPPGTARIRFVVRDMGDGRVGTADLKP